MTSSVARSSLTKRITATAAVLGLATIAIAAAPKPANAWWYHHGYCCGVGIGVVVPPIVVAPPPTYYAPPQTYYAQPQAYYAPSAAYYGTPSRAWIPAHWQNGYWVPGHWS
jgi:hypothetical protein